MRFLSLLMMGLFSAAASAHCPEAFKVNQKKFCLTVEWEFGEKRTNGVFETSGNLSPYAIKQGEAPPTWIYSRALVSVWADGDTEHKPVKLDNFKVFPYMYMDDGKHHPATYKFTYDEANGAYMLSSMALHKMAGCWSLRWTTDSSENLSTSKPLMDIIQYSNFSEKENKEAEAFCKSLNKSAAPTAPASGGHHHH